MRGEDAVSADRLRLILNYTPETGLLTWLNRPIEMFTSHKGFKVWNGKNAGKEAFTSINLQGYKQGSIKPHVFLAHRVVWAIHYGAWPDHWIDHINTDKTDNRICNLRPCTASQNGMNRNRQGNNTSGFKGVSFYKLRAKWEANICVDGAKKRLGYFATKEEAAKAYDMASEIGHAEFCRNNGVGK